MNKIDLFIEFSTLCNYKCVFCNRDVEKRIIHLSDIKDKLGKILSSGNISYCDITGYGEITFHPDFKEILNYFSQMKVPVRFVTNGSLLNNEIISTIKDSSVSEIVISLNSLDEEIYKKLSNNKDLKLVLNNIDNLVKVYNKKLIFSFVMNNYNFHEVFNFIDFGKKYNKGISCLGLTPTLNYPNDLIIQPIEENKKKLIEYRKYANKNGVPFFIFNFDSQPGTKERDNNLSEQIKKCTWVDSKFFIESDGNTYTCCWSRFCSGNIKDNTFEEIWNGYKHNELRECIKNGDLKYCSKCRAMG